MKNQIRFWSVVLVALAIVVMIGCVTKNPQYTPILPGQPQTNVVPAYVVNPSVNTYSNAATGINNAIGPANPYGSLTGWGINAIFGGLGLISAYIARQKSGALGSLASSVVQAGAHPAVLEAAANTPHFAAIASAINDNVASNQSLTGTPPKV